MGYGPLSTCSTGSTNITFNIHTHDPSLRLTPQWSNVGVSLQSYAEAQSNTIPPYQETTAIAPSDPGEMIIDDLPTGSVLVFTFNLFISFFF